MSVRPARRPNRESRVEMTEIVLPEDTNQYGHAWGGRVMALIDKAAAIAAMRHGRTNVVTASVDSLVFRAPVKLGHILKTYASVNAAFRTSMEVGVKVLSEDPIRRSAFMKITLSIIKADVGSIGGHIKPSETMIRRVKEFVASEGQGILIDSFICHTGDDISILSTHTGGVDNSRVHKLCWDA